jgi:hypothetical protein
MKPETTPPAVPTAEFRWLVHKDTWLAQQISEAGFLGFFKRRMGSAVLQQLWRAPGATSGGEWRDVPTVTEAD